MTQLRTLGL
jgi:hypothetical protein